MWLVEENEGDAARGVPRSAQASILLLGDIGVVENHRAPQGTPPRRRPRAAHRARCGRARRRLHRARRRGGRRHHRPSTSMSDSASAARSPRSAACLRCPRSTGSPWANGARASAPATRSSSTRAARPRSCSTAYAAAKAEVREAYDLGDLELRPAPTIRSGCGPASTPLPREACKPYVVVAVHEKTGEVAGLTEVVVPAQHPTRADQYDTVVVPESPRLRRRPGDQGPDAVRAALGGAGPGRGADLERGGQRATHRVNQELGFVPDRQWLEYEADVGRTRRRPQGRLG